MGLLASKRMMPACGVFSCLKPRFFWLLFFPRRAREGELRGGRGQPGSVRALQATALRGRGGPPGTVLPHSPAPRHKAREPCSGPSSPSAAPQGLAPPVGNQLVWPWKDMPPLLWSFIYEEFGGRRHQASEGGGEVVFFPSLISLSCSVSLIKSIPTFHRMPLSSTMILHFPVKENIGIINWVRDTLRAAVHPPWTAG